MLANTLARDFNVAPEDKVQCAQMITTNARELGILTDIKGSEYLHLEKLDNGMAATELLEQENFGEDNQDSPLEDESSNFTSSSIHAKTISVVKPHIFISHSKNLKILDQIKQVLAFGQFDFEVAIDKETTAIPIPEKIFGLMRKCNCALINVSADEQEKRQDGSYGVNANVLIEIGGAFLTYNKRVVLLVDKRVQLPSNLQGLYRCDYEGDALSWDTGMKLQKALSEFREMLQKAET